MRVGVISDVHGNDPALAVVLTALTDQVDMIIFLGDLCGYYPFVNECAAVLDTNGFVGVLGNHDRVLLGCLSTDSQPPEEYVRRYGSALGRSLRVLSRTSLSLLQSLPVSRKLSLAGVSVALFHGAPWDCLEGRVYPDYTEWDRFTHVEGDVILLGHTHYPLVKRHRGKLIVNPGSVGQARDWGGAACYAVLDVLTGHVEHRRVAFDPTRLVQDARVHDPQVPYLVDVLFRRKDAATP